MLGIVAIVVHRGDIIRAAPPHLGQCRVIQLHGMLHRVRAGAHGITRALQAIRMNREPDPKRVRGIGRRLHLFVRERLPRREVAAGAGGAEHLHPIGARSVDLLAHRPQNLGHAVHDARIGEAHMRA